VISLLRLGDVMMTAPAIEAARKKYPKAKIDLLVNKSCKIVGPLFADVNSVIEFERDLLQDGLAQADRPLFEPFDRLKKFIAHLNENAYDVVINLTQNKLSGYLTSAIQAQEKLGLTLNMNGQPSYGSSWFKFLNDIIAAGGETVFHYADIFANGIAAGTASNAVAPTVNLDQASTRFQLSETAAGRAEAETFFQRVGYKSGPKIVVQALTSDEKKNWGLKSWVESLTQLMIFEPEAHIILLGAPNEEESLEQLSAELAKKNVKADLAIVSLEGALSLLSVSDLLLTGDTSIKHLACASPIPVLEIALGSSDLRKTGAIKPNSLIVKSAESCAPCRHDEKCFREQRFCAAKMSPDGIALAATKFLRKDWAALRTLAEEYSSEIEFYRTERLSIGVWCATNLLHYRTEKRLSQQIDLAAWKFFLDREHLKPLAEYGSGSLRIKDQLDVDWMLTDQRLLKISLEQIENSTIAAEARLNRVLAELSRRVRATGGFGDIDFLDSNLKAEISAIEKTLGLGQFLSEKMALSPSTGLLRARQLQSSLNETFSHQQIKLKLIRSLRNQIMEYQ